MDISGKVFIVTGGASGLGEGTVRMLASQGAKVVIADLQVEKGQALAAEVGGVFVKCDVSQEADGQAVVAAATAAGKLMGLVNCAGIAPAIKTVGKDGAHPLANFSKTISVNLIGTFNMIRLAAEAMCKNAPEPTGERGVLISTDSVAAYDGQIGQAAYSASKAAVRYYGEGLRGCFAKQGIEVNVICPGYIKTPMTDRNDFYMPFLMGADVAARRIIRGLEKNTSRIAFPRRLYWPLWWLSCLSPRITDPLFAALPAKPSAD